MTRNNSDSSEGGRAQNSHPESKRQRRSGAASDFMDAQCLSESMLTKLGRTIEAELVPRLMLAFETERAARRQPVAVGLDQRVGEFVDLVLRHDAAVAIEYVATLRDQGTPLTDVYLDLLAPAARKLGDMWDNDDASFTEVTIGVCRMHQVLLEFSHCFRAADNGSNSGRCVLIVPTPGEEHTFGLFLVIEFLRRAGWNCYTGAPSSLDELRKLVRTQSFDAVGLSLSADRNANIAAEAIVVKRRQQVLVSLIVGRAACRRGFSGALRRAGRAAGNVRGASAPSRHLLPGCHPRPA